MEISSEGVVDEGSLQELLLVRVLCLLELNYVYLNGLLYRVESSQLWDYLGADKVSGGGEWFRGAFIKYMNHTT